MVTYFNKKDLISFGNYLFSEERRELFKNHPNHPNPPNISLEERLSEVNHSDFHNWKEKQKK